MKVCEVRWPRTRGLATGLRATCAPISERPAVVSGDHRVPTCCANSKEDWKGGLDECRGQRRAGSSPLYWPIYCGRRLGQ
jgi:hypothetical protein